ncbi:MAG: DegT/DnrJ/EryC1/StrS family aminotransferase [Elusimicrobiota bacterium]|jgi:dTDP-4-amino-4,6-dideoxygalactose transaminase
MNKPAAAVKPGKVPLMDFKQQYSDLREELLAAATRVMDSGMVINGPEVKAFETEFAAAMGAPHCVGCSNGTDAIELALKACGVGPGDEVAVPAFTFIATATAVSSIGAKPVFIDIEPRNFTIDPAALERALTPRMKAVVPVHLFGFPADMDAVLAVARKGGLRVVEDCAQAHGCLYKGKPVGTMGDIGTFSFYPSKNMGALGDAGAVVTRDAKLAETCTVLRDAGRAKGERYLHALPGRNARLDELQAAFLRIKLRRLAAWNEKRSKIAALYRRELKGLPVTPPTEDAAGTRHVYHLFVARAQKRDALLEALTKAEVGCAVYYPVALHMQPAFKDLGRREGDFPVSEQACREAIALPMYPDLSEESALRVTSEIRKFYKA